MDSPEDRSWSNGGTKYAEAPPAAEAGAGAMAGKSWRGNQTDENSLAFKAVRLVCHTLCALKRASIASLSLALAEVWAATDVQRDVS